MILMGPLNAFVARKMKALQIDQMRNKDKRNKMMDEILNGIKIIKLYAWESSFSNQVSAIRDKEIAALKKIAYLNAGMTFLWVQILEWSVGSKQKLCSKSNLDLYLTHNWIYVDLNMRLFQLQFNCLCLQFHQFLAAISMYNFLFFNKTDFDWFLTVVVF